MPTYDEYMDAARRERLERNGGIEPCQLRFPVHNPYECPVCGALVRPEAWDGHCRWHLDLRMDIRLCKDEVPV